MNEQIKELLNKTSAFGPGGDTMDRYNCSLSDLEKFAQLIVRECADICYHHSNAAGGVDTHFGYGYKDCGNDIKRNFGVEE